MVGGYWSCESLFGGGEFEGFEEDFECGCDRGGSGVCVEEFESFYVNEVFV
jgi:hypothetical protein